MPTEEKPLQQTKEQERAAAAWADIAEVNNSAGVRPGKYRSWVKKFPMLVLTNGLGQALAFTRAKNKDHHRLFYKHLSVWVLKEMMSSTQQSSLLEWLMEKDSNAYRRATTETLAFVNWLKRFAEAEIAQEEEDD